MSELLNIVDDKSKSSLSNFFEVFRVFLRYLLKLSWIPIILALALGYYFHKKESEKPILYSAETSFVKSDVLTNVGAIGDFSFAQLTDKPQTDIVYGLIYSDAVLGKALLTEIGEGSSQLLINYYLDVYPFEGQNIRISSSNLDSLSTDERRIYNITKLILKSTNSQLLVFQPGEISLLTSNTKDENLSYYLVNIIYTKLVDFYKSKQSESYDETIEALEVKRDSTFSVLRRFEAQLAGRKDKSGLRVVPTQQLPETDLQRKIALTQADYSSLYSFIENLKIRKSQNYQDYYKQLNFPVKPLLTTDRETFKQTLFGVAIGLLIGLILVFILFWLNQLRKIYKSIYS